MGEALFAKHCHVSGGGSLASRIDPLGGGGVEGGESEDEAKGVEDGKQMR